MDDKNVLENAISQLAFVQQWLLASLGSHKYAMTLSHARVLVNLFERGPQTMGELAERLGITHSTCSELVAGLEQVGWVARKPSPHDRRSVIVEHSAKARAAAAEVRKRRGRVIEDVLQRLGPEERAGFLRGLLELGRLISAMSPEMLVISTGPARIRPARKGGRKKTRLTTARLAGDGGHQQAAKAVAVGGG